MNIPESKLNRALELVATSRHIALATTNEDGSPHNSPVRFHYDTTFENIYWSSSAKAQHSLNVIRTSQLFGVLYDRLENGGVYLKLESGRPLKNKELEIGLEIINFSREKDDQQKIPLEYYSSESSQKLWSAKVVHVWINMPVRDDDGRILRDERVELDKSIFKK